jgi:hypothetical protein
MARKEKRVTYKGFCTYFKNVSFAKFLKMSRAERFNRVQSAAWVAGRDLYNV